MAKPNNIKINTPLLFTVVEEKIYQLHPEADEAAIKNYLDVRIEQLLALNFMLCLDSDPVNNMSDVLRTQFKELCYSLTQECSDLIKALPHGRGH